MDQGTAKISESVERMTNEKSVLAEIMIYSWFIRTRGILFSRSRMVWNAGCWEDVRRCGWPGCVLRDHGNDWMTRGVNEYVSEVLMSSEENSDPRQV